ncbi:MAG TPA: GNAT family N-acetyltransferase [Solirubrobacteraceae bacterium]|jgi:ribosomal protein S18 acetylase RimI-like enzyme|nr:GNAT family N-acetyltransferase [Solirubrobacteraceae bacterium]
MGRETQTAPHAEAIPGVSASALSPTVRVAEPGESGSLKAALAAAFFDDPIFGWLIGRSSNRQARLEQYFAIQLAHSFADGCVWTSEGLQGAALCMPPGRWRLPPKLMIAHGAHFAGVFRGRLPRAIGLLAVIERHHLRGAHYYFANIGVAPEAQGQGLGSRLMRPTLDRCDEEGLPAYLEASSERNAALYERLGFQCTEVLRFAGSPPLRLMMRPPQPAQQS